MNILKAPLRWFIRVDMILGEKQLSIPRADAGSSITNYLRVEEGAEIGIMSFNFPNREWDKDNPKAKPWLDWLYNNRGKACRSIKVLGGPKVEAKKSLDFLIDKDIIELRLLNAPEVFHIVYVTNPKQLWIEQYHRSHPAWGVNYTDMPFENTWLNMLDLFNKKWEIASPVPVRKVN